MFEDFCQESFENFNNKNSKTIADKAFPGCLSTKPNERDLTSLLVALDIQNLDNYVISIHDEKTGIFKTHTLSGKELRRSKDEDKYVLTGNSLSYSDLLDISKTENITWLPNPVNPENYGRSRNHVARFNTIVVESDHLSHDEQWEKIQWLGLLGLPPTIVLSTGGKSLHMYFRLTEDCTADEYLKAKKILVMLVEADTAVSLVEKSRLPGFFRPGKEYVQELIYTTASRTDINDIFEVFRSQFNRDITDELWVEYKLSRTGKSSLSPDQVLVTPDKSLPVVVGKQEREKQAEIRKKYRLDNPTNIDCGDYFQACKDAIKRIDEGATKEDFVALGFNIKREYPGYTMGSFGTDGKGTSVKLSVHDGRLVAYSFNDYLVGTSLSATYSQLWLERNGYKDLSGGNFFKMIEALALASGITLPERPQKYNKKIELIPDIDVPTDPRNKTIAICERFLPTWLLEGITAPIVSIRSDWGTGKTMLMREIKDKLAVNDWFIMLTPLQSLARNNAVKLDIYYKTEYDEHVRHLSMCLHNLHDKSSVGAKLLPQLRNTTGKIHLVFDEAECLRKGLLALDSTLSKNQISIINTIGEIASLPNTTTWLLDADLSKDTVDFYSDCIRQYLKVDASYPVPVHAIENLYQNQIENLYLYPTRDINGKKLSPATVLKHALESANTGDDMVLLAVTGQKVSHQQGKYSAQSAAKYFEDRGYEGRVLVVDSETTAVEGSLAAGIIEDPTRNLELAKKLGYKIIIFTLGIFKTGISIEKRDTRLFHAIYVISTGLISPELVIQTLFRVRDMDVPRYLFVAEQGFNYLANRAKTKAKAVASLNKDKIEQLYGHTLSLSTPTRTVEVTWLLDQWSGVVVNHNVEMTEYYESIQKLMPRAAKTIHTQELDCDGQNRLTESGDEVKAVLVEYQKQTALDNAIAITNAQDLSHKQADNLKQKNKKTKEENRSLVKYFLTHTTGRNQLTPEDVYNNDEGYFNKAKLYLLSTRAYPLIGLLDAIALSKIEDNNPIRQAGVVRKFKVDIAKKILDLGLQAIIRLGTVTNHCPMVTRLVEDMIGEGLLVPFIKPSKRGEVTYLTSSGELEEWLGMITFKNSTDLIKKLLGELGMTLVLSSNSRKDERGNKIREYQVRSLWRDIEGNHNNQPMDKELENHWLTGYLTRCLTFLTGEEVRREELGGRLTNLPDGDKFDPLRGFGITA